MLENLTQPLLQKFKDMKAQSEQLKDICDNLNQQINDRNNNITQLNAIVQTKETEIQARDQELSIVKPIAATVPQLTKERNQAIHDNKLSQQAEDGQQQKIKDLQAQLEAEKSKGFWGKIKSLLS